MAYFGLQRLTTNMFKNSNGNRYMLRSLSGYVEFLASQRTFFGAASKPFTCHHGFSYGTSVSKSGYICRYFTSEGPQMPPKRSRKFFQPITWRTLGITLGIGSAVLITMLYFKKEKQQMIEKKRKIELGKAAIGGKFDLMDHNGKPCSSDDLLGKWLMIYFGFTHCPDVCPEEIEKMIEVVEIIEKSPKFPNILPLMITVDAERDNVQVLAKYVKEFSPKLIGLTGSKEQVHRATRVYRVYYSEGPKDEDNDYIVDHTIIIYLINPDGEFVDYYGQTKSADQIANAIKLQMNKYEIEHKKSWFG